MFRKLALTGAMLLGLASGANAVTCENDPVHPVLTTICNNQIGSGGAASTVKIDQSTPGTTNGVQVNAALPAGAAIIGKAGIDQTTDGTTNKVAATQATAANLKMEPAGNVADAAADSGNPLKVGAIYESTLPTYTTGQRGNAHIGSRGSLHTEIWGSDAASAATVSTQSDGISNAANGLTGRSLGYTYNGATWDRAFTCASQVAATITAAATTQIIALSGTTVIRVCSYQVGIATTGTFKFVQGTGSNCGTGTADITPATNLIAGNVVAVSAGNNSIFRTSAGGALCVAAVTGNVQVFVTYAQF